MTYFLTLFLLSIGVSFGQADLDYNNQTKAQLKNSNMHIKSTNGIDASRMKLYSDNKGLIKIQPIGELGWGGSNSN